MVQIRPIRPEDAEAYTRLLAQVDNESAFLLFEPGERTTTGAQWRTMISAMATEEVSTILVAEHEGELVGFLRARGETIRRLRHMLYLVVAVREAFAGQGIGTQLFMAVEEWARERKLHRLYLAVMTNNQRAIALYQKIGFVVEGRHLHAALVNGRYVDEYTMAKLLD
jgi:RimJ/RimL family protein N-acetyltransferase